MLHFTGMHVASALLFETPEQIFTRVFRQLKPGTSAPPIRVQFFPFANPNSQIRMTQGDVAVRITDVMAEAPAPVLESLAWVLLSKLFRKPVPSDELLRYRGYLQRKDIRDLIHSMRQKRGRKLVSDAQGAVYDLNALFDQLNFHYFHGLMPRPDGIGWSLRASRGILGHYDPSHHTIVLSKHLDSRDVPRMLVEFVMFHEMLHIQFPTEHRRGRRCVHTPAFKAAEKKFEHYQDAKEALKKI